MSLREHTRPGLGIIELRGHRMRMLDLENAIKFEKMAAEEKDTKLKEHFEKQAAAYRKLAEKRAKDYGLNVPSQRD